MKTTDKQNIPVLTPYTVTRIKNRFLVSNFFGSWVLLEKSEFRNIETGGFIQKSALFQKLKQAGIALDSENIQEAIDGYRRMNAHLFTDTSLNIAVVTTRCNLSCSYCQTKTIVPCDMDFKTAIQVVKYLYDSQAPSVNLEFQGGEPLLNWPIVKFMIEQSRKINSGVKKLHISCVTNGTLLDSDKMSFLFDNDVDICISLDGPLAVHDKNRVFPDGKGTYAIVKKAIADVNQAYKKKKLRKTVSLLSTITRPCLEEPEALIDEYLSWGVTTIALRPVNEIGMARERWSEIGYAPEIFIGFWTKAMDHILTCNKKGMRMKERMAAVLLTKILKKNNPGYVDLMSPCGAGRSVLVYNPNGDIYPCDEARMVDKDLFKLGNIHKNTYIDIMKSPKQFCLCEASVVDLWDYNSAFLPWTGTCPVLNFALQKNLVPKITATPMHKILHAQLHYLFEKMICDKKSLGIFNSWM